MKKRLLSAVLVLLMLVAFVPVTAAAEEGKLYGEMPIYLGFPDVDYMAEEILKELDLIGTVSQLRRTAIDDVKVEDCDTLDDILQGNYRNHDVLELLSSRYETVVLDDLSDVKNGKPLELNADAEQVLISDGKEAVAIYRKQDGLYRCARGLW